MSPKTVLITGSSSGFGLSLVQLFLRQGHNVIATSRSPQKTPDLVSSVENHTGKRGRWVQLDVTWPQAKITSTVSEAAKFFGPIDVLINNAGYSHCGSVEEIDEEKARVQFDTNYWGVLRMCKAILPSMRGRKQGTIINISSIAGLNALPIMPVYAGSKWALEAMTESLSQEVASFNIRVHIVEPGAFKTNFLSSGAIGYTEVTDGYKGTIVEAITQRYKHMEGKQIGDPEKAAARIYDLILGEGWATGKTGYLRLPLGPDCWERATKALKGRLANIEDLKDVATSTSFDAEK